jgi:hypothetical protein
MAGKLVKMMNESRLSRPFHMVKMVAAVCPDRDYPGKSHQPSTASTGFWIPACEAAGHDPWVRAQEVEIVRPTYETREDGRKFKTGEEIEIELVETPNLEQIPYDIKAYSGKALEFYLEMGWKQPEELGYAPFCEYLGCWNQNPKFQTNVGLYCNRNEAALMVLVTGNDMRSDTGTPTYLTFGEDEPNFQRQLDGVNIQGAGRETGVAH